MRFSVWPAPHGTFEALCELARHAEATAWDGLWYADHFMPSGGDLSRPVSECWTTLAALSVAVPRLTLGPLVCGNTYRHPAVLAKMAATLDRVCGGRLVLGLGAAWQQNEHEAYGIELPPIGPRLDRLEEACQVVRSLFEQERSTFTGRHYRLHDAVLEPKPLQRPLPLLVGGGGERRTLRIAARFADAWNAWGTPQEIRRKVLLLDRHCEAVGRDPAAIRRTAVAHVLVVDPADPDGPARIARGARGQPQVVGTAEYVREAVHAFAEAGVDEVIVPDFHLGDAARRRAAWDRFSEEVAPAFR